MPKGRGCPYLDELTFVVVPTQDAQVIRFQAGDSQIISGLSADNFAVLEPEQKARHFKLYDAGPGLEYNFLMFNLNDDTDRLPEVARKQKWFRDARFRQAVSAAIDRAGIVRLVYRNRGAAIATHVSPGNKAWFNAAIPVPAQSPAKARELLHSGGLQLESGQHAGGFQRPARGVQHCGELQQHAARPDRNAGAGRLEGDWNSGARGAHGIPLGQ